MERWIAGIAWVILAVASTRCLADPATGENAPDVVLGTSATGAPVKAADYSGKVVVVSFWASWCGPCRKELPILEGLQRNGKGSIQVVAVNIESHDVFRKAVKLLSEAQVLLANDPNSRSQRAYGVKAIPHMVIIGRDGRIREVHKGYGEDSLPGIVDEINAALTANAAESGAKS
jgi:thiol-disulfide isomerase/thioredoxin